jgi:hypothetical protein
MAFPYQFGSLGDLTLESCNSSKFEIYCNSFLPSEKLLQHWYQYFNLSLAGFAAGAAVILWIVQHCWHVSQRQRLHRQGAAVRERVEKIDDQQADFLPDLLPLPLPDQNPRNSGLTSLKNPSSYSLKTSELSPPSFTPLRSSGISTPERYHAGPPAALSADLRKSMQSISLRSEDDSATTLTPSQNYDLVMIPLFANTVKDSQRMSTSRPASFSNSATARTFVGLFELQDLGTGVLSGQALCNAAIALNTRRVEKGCAGLVLHINNYDTCTAQITELLRELCQRQVGVVLMCDPEIEALQSINFGLLVGTIFKNACILDNGERRNFFQTIGLREMMGRCAEERLLRPGFFVKFLDLWSVQPTAAVARRARKLAGFFGASLEHGAKPDRGWAALVKYPLSLSALDYLKRSEVVEVGHPLVLIL